jgi:hypothetical protein
MKQSQARLRPDLSLTLSFSRLAGMVDVLDSLTLQEALPALIAHTGNCVCIKFDSVNK